MTATGELPPQILEQIQQKQQQFRVHTQEQTEQELSEFFMRIASDLLVLAKQDAQQQGIPLSQAIPRILREFARGMAVEERITQARPKRTLVGHGKYAHSPISVADFEREARQEKELEDYEEQQRHDTVKDA